MAGNKRNASAPARPKHYHHGDLAVALIETAEAVLTERGVEGFTLRECARRAGVSHAAPAHHFGDARGLLTAVATVGFERLTDAQRVARQQEPELNRLLVATGTAYVRFALTHPAQFQLMFHTAMVDKTNNQFAKAAGAAFDIYLETYAAVLGKPSRTQVAVLSGHDPDVLRQWALVHGLATLAVQGQFGPSKGKAAIERLTRIVRSILEDAAPAKAAAPDAVR